MVKPNDIVRMHRRRFLGSSLAAAAGGGLLLAGCGGDDEAEKQSTPQRTPSGEPRRGGTLRAYSQTPILTLDPNDILGMATAPYFYSYLIHGTDWQGVVGDLAKSWEVVDDLHWTFNLREDARFADIDPVNGRALTSDDIRYSLDRVESMPGASPESAKAYTGRETPDAHTLIIHTKDPEGYMLDNMGSPLLAVVPREAVDRFGDLKSNALGSGPFVLESWGRDEGLRVSSNPTYYHDFPYVDGINLKVMADDSLIQVAFRSNNIDYYDAPDRVSADAVKDIQGVNLQTYRDRTYSTFMLNGTRIEGFKDQRTREAVDRALDRKAMIERLYFGGAELAGPVPPVFDSALPADEIERAYQVDVEKAKSLLSAAGVEGLKFQLLFSTSNTLYSDMASVIKADLDEAGITVELRGMEHGSYLGALLGGDFEAALYEHAPYLADDIPIQSHHSHHYLRIEALYLGVDDPEVDSTLDRIQRTIGHDERVSMIQQVERRVLERHGPTLTLVQPHGYWCAYDYIKGYEATAYGFGMYKYDFWIDKT